MLRGWRKERIEENRTKLTKDIDLNETLWNLMIEYGVLDIAKRKELKKGCEADDVYVRRLLEYLLKRPETDFDKFCECLRQSNQVHIVETYLTRTEQTKVTLVPLTEQTPASDQGNVNDATQPFLCDIKDSLSQGQNSENIGPPAEQVHRRCSRMCTRKAKLITFGLTAISVTVIIVVSVMTSKSQTKSLFHSAAPAINITNACLNAARNGTQTVSQDDGRCGKKDPGFYPDDGSCASFYLCCAGGKLAGEGTCPGNYSFHPESQMCVDTRDTFYRDPSHCGKYYQCHGTPPIRTEQRSCHEDTYLRLDPPPPTCAHKDNVKDCHKKPLIPTL